MKLKGIIAAAAGCIALTLGSAGAAQAESYQYSRTGAGGGAGGDLLEFFEFTYSENAGVETFAAEIKFTPEIVKGGPDGGFWIVVSDGPNPKGGVQEYAILYADLDTNRITAYEYNGDNTKLSYDNPGNLLQVFNNAMTYENNAGNVGNDGLVTFEIDVTSINTNAALLASSSEWDGVKFDETIGVWFHFMEDVDTAYSGHELTKFDFDEQGWVDFKNKTAVNISEPSSVALLGLGLVGFAAYRRRSAV